MARGIRKRINHALECIAVEMRNHGDGMYARGLSSEGYAGGYAQALRDVKLLLDGVEPRNDRGYWSKDSFLASQAAEMKRQRKHAG